MRVPHCCLGRWSAQAADSVGQDPALASWDSLDFFSPRPRGLAAVDLDGIESIQDELPGYGYRRHAKCPRAHQSGRMLPHDRSVLIATEN